MAASDLEGDAIRQYRLRTIEIVRFANTGTLCQSDAPANHLDRNPGLLSDSDVSPWADAVDGEWRLGVIASSAICPTTLASRLGREPDGARRPGARAVSNLLSN